jgi:hypothetical protein
MAKTFELKPDRTAVIDSKLRGAFREIVSGRTTVDHKNSDVQRMSNERGEIITSRNVQPPKKRA